MARKEYKPITIDVEPFLSIMAIVLKLITLILVVIVLRIVMNPKLKKVVALEGLYAGRGNTENPKEPAYLDCYPDRVMLYADKAVISNSTAEVTWEGLQRPGNPVEALLDNIQAHKEDRYIVVMVRPKSVKLYRAVRNLVSKRPIDVGYDAVYADFKVNWDAARKALSIAED